MPLPQLHYRSAGFSSEDAYCLWRDIMAPMYHVERAAHAEGFPGGSLSAILMGDILANRTSFGPQHVTRSKRLIDRSPDHLVFQYWRTGGTRGEVGGVPSSYKPGQVALADRRLEVDSLITKSDTIGFVIPRSLLEGVNVDDLSRHLDPARNRLAAARIMGLWRCLPNLEPADVPAVTADFLAFFRRLFDPSQAADVLEGAELDVGVLDLAERVIDNHLGSPTLSPDTIAAELGVSRASLYRAAQPLGGIMRHVGERRLAAAKVALGDPLETRSLTTLSEDLGFSTLPVFSRAFRARYGVSPREWRETIASRWKQRQQVIPDPIWHWFSDIGR